MNRIIEHWMQAAMFEDLFPAWVKRGVNTGLLLAWNMLKMFPVFDMLSLKILQLIIAVDYSNKEVIAVDYSNKEVYQLAVLGDFTDLIGGACPVSITAIDQDEPMLQTKWSSTGVSSPLASTSSIGEGVDFSRILSLFPIASSF